MDGRGMSSSPEKRAAWRAANKERLQEYERSPERRKKARERARKWKTQNPERARERDRNLSLERKAKKSATKKLHREKNPGCATHHARWSYFKKRGAVPPWANRAAVEVFYRTAAVLSIYSGKEFQVDHIVPVRSEVVCGLHCEANLQILPLRANLAKSNLTWPDAS
jgi:hypothetical protein